MGDEELTDAFHIVFMCTGNQARSVIAEYYTRKITDGLPVTVESVGLLDTRGASALPEAIEAGQGLALDLAAHVSRPFTAIELNTADLVLGFEQQHIATAVVEGNSGFDRTFKLLELVRLLGQVRGGASNDPAAAREAVARAAATRSAADSFRPGEDLADPAGRDARFFKETAESIRTAWDEIVGALFAPPSKAEASIGS